MNLQLLDYMSHILTAHKLLQYPHISYESHIFLSSDQRATLLGDIFLNVSLQLLAPQRSCNPLA